MTKQQLKKRLVGAVVLVSLAVIFIPMMLDNRASQKQLVSGIPSRDTGPYNEELASAKPIPITPIRTEPAPAPEPKLVQAVKPKPVIEAGPPAEPKVDVRPSTTVAAPHTAWVVQVGSFSKKDGADSTAARLRKAGFDTLIVQASVNGNTVYRVQVGPEADKARAEALQQRIKDKLKFDGKVMSYPSR